MTNQVTPHLPQNLETCLECFKNQILRMGFTEDRSFVVDSIDYILEVAKQERDGRHGQNRNLE